MNIILGKKIKMTRIFDKENKVVPITLIEAGPCQIVSKDGSSIVIGYMQIKKPTKAQKNYFKLRNCQPLKYTRKIAMDNDSLKRYEDKKEITVDIFKPGSKVNITSISKGKGFAGTMKRHNFSGMPASHGHEKQRIPGSIGCRFPQRTIKGKKMAGHMGNKKTTIKNLKVIDIDSNNNILAIKGSIPGIKNTLVSIESK
jgi:large subunit ribosomal protein L3